MFTFYAPRLIVSLALLLMLTGCGGGASSSVATTVGAFVIASDRSTGSFGVIDPTTHEATSNAGQVHSDATARSYNGLIYVLNRLGADNVQVIDPQNGYSTLRQFSVGSGANPFDIEFVSASKAYVSRYGTTELWIIDPSTGTQTGSIDLAAYADSDGIPEMAGMAIKNGKLFVSLQSLDRNAFFSATGNSQIVVIDIASNSVTGSIPLPYQNPVGDFVALPNGLLALPCAGIYGVIDGGVVIVDTATSTATASSITEELLGGDLNGLVMTTATAGFAVINDASFNTMLVRFSEGEVSTIYSTDGYSLFGLALNGSEIWVSDQTSSAPGIRIFDTTTGAAIAGPISVGLPPSVILFL